MSQAQRTAHASVKSLPRTAATPIRSEHSRNVKLLLPPALSRELNLARAIWKSQFGLRVRWRLATSGKLLLERHGACGGM